MRHLALVALLAATPAMAQVTIEQPWARATPPGAKVGGAYMTIRNAGATPDRLIGVASPAAERVEMHVTAREGEISRMREVKGYAVPAHGSFELKPGGAHLMFVNLKAPFKEGQSVSALLKFEKAGEVKVQFAVRGLGAASQQHQHMH